MFRCLNVWMWLGGQALDDVAVAMVVVVVVLTQAD